MSTIAPPPPAADLPRPPELISEITLRLHAGPGLATAELAQFDRLARRRNRTREELLIDLIREELAAAVSEAAAA